MKKIFPYSQVCIFNQIITLGKMKKSLSSNQVAHPAIVYLEFYSPGVKVLLPEWDASPSHCDPLSILSGSLDNLLVLIFTPG